MARQIEGNSGGHIAAAVGQRGRRIDVRSGGGTRVRGAADGGATYRSRSPHSLVQPVRSSEGVARHDAAPRGRRIVVLPALLHGPDPGRWNPEARLETFP